MEAEEMKPSVLSPPFSRDKAIYNESQICHPAAVGHQNFIIRPHLDVQKYLDIELRIPKLNNVHSYLWLAGLLKPARPLHRQRLMNRAICLTENPDEHLVWHEARIFIKPVPGYLLDYDHWDKELCADLTLHECACGLLLSYSWIIARKSDFLIAQETGVLPKEIEWLQWTGFMNDFLDHINIETLHQVNGRYRYGELRLSRLDSLYRVLPHLFSMRHLVSGFMTRSTWYRAFFERNFTWIVTLLVYLTAVLSAFQVGLAIPQLSGNGLFVEVAYVVSVASIVAFASIVSFIFVVWVTLFSYHLHTTMRFWKRTEKERTSRLNSAG